MTSQACAAVLMWSDKIVHRGVGNAVHFFTEMSSLLKVFIQTKSKLHHSMYHAIFIKYVKSH